MIQVRTRMRRDRSTIFLIHRFFPCIIGFEFLPMVMPELRYGFFEIVN
jgi:hypothetical protein